MLKSAITVALLVAKIYLSTKVLLWVVDKLTHPLLHTINEIDWVLALLLLDTWLISHTKIEISAILKKND